MWTHSAAELLLSRPTFCNSTLIVRPARYENTNYSFSRSHSFHVPAALGFLWHMIEAVGSMSAERSVSWLAVCSSFCRMRGIWHQTSDKSNWSSTFNGHSGTLKKSPHGPKTRVQWILKRKKEANLMHDEIVNEPSTSDRRGFDKTCFTRRHHLLSLWPWETFLCLTLATIESLQLTTIADPYIS